LWQLGSEARPSPLAASLLASLGAEIIGVSLAASLIGAFTGFAIIAVAAYVSYEPRRQEE
jgi:hypothetical protein